jgi:hypothetical protein
MAHTILERPIEFCFSKNELRYIYEVTNLNRAGLYFEIKLVCETNNNGVVTYPTFRLKPNADGKVYFYFNQYIDTFLSYQLPSNLGPVTNASLQWCKFYVHTREVTTANPSDPFNTHEQTKKRICFKGGVEQSIYSRNNWFNYFTLSKMWLSYLHQNCMVYPNQPVYLTALITSGQLVNCKLRFTITDFSLSTTVVDVNVPLSYGYIFHFNVDHQVFGVNNPLQTVYKYEVVLLDASNDALTATHTFFINHDFVKSPHHLLFFNSLSGISTVCVRGETTYSLDKIVTEVEGNFDINAALNNVQQYTNNITGINTTKLFKGDIGLLDSKEEQEFLIDLIHSRFVYEFIRFRWVALQTIAKSQPLGSAKDTLLTFPIEWKLQETNEVFTPSTLPLTIGSDTEIYP